MTCGDPAHTDTDLSLQWAKAIRTTEAILKITVPVADRSRVNTGLASALGR